MDDIIGQGEDRPPGWRRRLLWVAATAVVVGLIVVEHFPHGAAPEPRHPSAHLQVRVGRVLQPVRLWVGGAAKLPTNGIPGNVAPWAASARLPRTGAQPAWFWPALGRVTPILGLNANRDGYVFTRVTGGWAIQSDPAGQAGCFDCTSSTLGTAPGSCGDCSGLPTPVFYLPDRARRARLVGSANLVAPGAAEGAIWLTRYPAKAHLARASGIALQYAGAGGAAGGPVYLPVGYAIAQATSRGLLLVPVSKAGQIITYRLWNPALDNVERSFQGVVAVSATEVAYEPPRCPPGCPLHVFNLNTGSETVIALPPADMVTAGRFSSDGRFLALEVSVNSTAYGELAVQLEVAPMPAGRIVVVPHSWVSSEDLVGFGWPTSRDDLVAEFRFNDRVQALFWHHARGSVSLADIAPRQDPFGLVIG